MDESASLDGFLGKWRTRWPEWELLAVFVPAPQRDVVHDKQHLTWGMRPDAVPT